MTRFLSISIVAILAVGTAGCRGPDRRPLAAVDFFGYQKLDVAAIRRALPFQEGDSFPPPKAHTDELKKQVASAIKRVIGREPTDVVFICCDAKQHYLVYVGLPGASYEAIAFNLGPRGNVHLAKAAVKLSDAMDDAWGNAIMNGNGTEEDSAGYTLTNDPKARKAELALREYALQHEDVLLNVLASSPNAGERAIAAQMVGYGRQFDGQIDALVHASLDPDGGVRNNAVRALEVLATAKPVLARRIPPEPFIRLLRSGEWLDHNKASLVLLALTTTREPSLLEKLRADALEPLLEMARWRYVGHAEAALMVLGRIAGIDEASLNKMIEAGQTSTILAKFNQ